MNVTIRDSMLGGSLSSLEEKMKPPTTCKKIHVKITPPIRVAGKQQGQVEITNVMKMSE